MDNSPRSLTTKDTEDTKEKLQQYTCLPASCDRFVVPGCFYVARCDEYANYARGGAVLERTVNVWGSVTDSGGDAPSLFRMWSSRRTVPSPIARIGCAIVVSAGS